MFHQIVVHLVIFISFTIDHFKLKFSITVARLWCLPEVLPAQKSMEA